MGDLLNNKSVICTTTKPTSKFNEYMKIINVPNNLDQYNKKYNSYCYDAPGYHKGILINCLLDETHENLFIHYLGFEFNIITDPDYKIIMDKEDTLKISLIYENDLLNFLDIDKHKDILKEFKAKEKEIKEGILQDKAISILNKNDLKEMELKPDVKKEIKNIIGLHANNNIGIYAHKLGKTYENYFYLRPFYLDAFIDNLIYLMENNTEINNFIQKHYKIMVNDLKEFQSNYKFNPIVYNLIMCLKPGNKKAININVLFDSHINNIKLNDAIANHSKYNNLNNAPSVFKMDL